MYKLSSTVTYKVVITTAYSDPCTFLTYSQYNIFVCSETVPYKVVMTTAYSDRCTFLTYSKYNMVFIDFFVL